MRISLLTEYLETRAHDKPRQTAFTFLENDFEGTTSLDYGELHEYIQSIGATIQQYCKKGDRALLLFPPGLEFVKAFFSCIYSNVIAVPVYPPNLRRMESTLPKILAIIQDSNPSVILTISSILNLSEGFFQELLPNRTIKWIATDLIVKDFADRFVPTHIYADDIALLQYTSGSTSQPKGVIISHSNLVNNLELIKNSFGHTSQSRGVIWLPPYHDMGLIGGILQPLFAGFPVTLMSPLSFLKRPFSWLQAISHFKATTSGGPNFAYEMCINKISAEQRDSLDLSSWDLAFNGAERISYRTLKKFADYFKPCGFREEAFFCCYGMAETTLIATGGKKTEKPIVQKLEAKALEKNVVVNSFVEGELSREIVGCGQAMPQHKIVTIHPEKLTLCMPDEVGEIWISGPSVSQGYWNGNANSDEVFNAFIKDKNEGPFMRSGDLGFLKDNELFPVGRLKDLIIIDGRNHYPPDIERTVEECHPALRQGGCAAFSINHEKGEQLIILAEINRGYKFSPVPEPQEESSPAYRVFEEGELLKIIRQVVSIHHQLSVFDIKLLCLGGVPKTSSGKIQRFICKEQYLGNTLKMI